VRHHALDGWDPASSVGLTATEAAAARAVAGRTSNPLVDDPYAEPLVRAVGVDFFIRLATGAHDESGFALPGMVDWVAVRSKFFDDYFIAAQNAGIRQSVILGAGLDSRPYRLCWAAESTVYEVDLPGVLDFKTRTMSALGAEPRVDRRPVAVDLRDDWVGALRDCGFDPTLPTAWSAEGLVPYLPPESQDHLLDSISELCTAGSWFAAETAADVDELTARIGKALGKNERPIASKPDIQTGGAVPTRVRREVAHHLQKQGWAAMNFPAPTLFALYGATPPAAEGLYECIEFVTAIRGA
jgi:methyltransferase (TIGR00027 family)